MSKRKISPFSFKKDEVSKLEAAPTPSKPATVKLTNKAGAFANPSSLTVDAWLKIGWYKV